MALGDACVSLMTGADEELSRQQPGEWLETSGSRRRPKRHRGMGFRSDAFLENRKGTGKPSPKTQHRETAGFACWRAERDSSCDTAAIVGRPARGVRKKREIRAALGASMVRRSVRRTPHRSLRLDRSPRSIGWPCLVRSRSRIIADRAIDAAERGPNDETSSNATADDPDCHRESGGPDEPLRSDVALQFPQLLPVRRADRGARASTFR